MKLNFGKRNKNKKHRKTARQRHLKINVNTLLSGFQYYSLNANMIILGKCRVLLQQQINSHNRCHVSTTLQQCTFHPVLDEAVIRTGFL